MAKKVGQLKTKHDIDALAYTGSSGAAAAYVLGVALDLPVVYVRKKGENSHGNKVESNADKRIRRYLVVDDFVCTGSTVERVISGIEKQAQENHDLIPECVGVFLYASEEKDKTVSITVNKKIREVKIFK